MADTVFDYAEQFRRDLIKRELAVEQRLVSAYRGLYVSVQAEIDALILEVANAGEEMTTAQLQRMRRYKTLLRDIETQMQGYKAFARNEMTQAARLSLDIGADDARTLAAVVIGDAKFAAQFRAINPKALEKLLGFLDPKGALYKRLDYLPYYTAEQVSQALIKGIGLGWNPRATARAITNALGMGLTDALRMCRTVQLYAYREANRASYLANDDVVRGWVWYADLTRACPSCVMMHGTEHTLDEKLNDHHNGHCAMLPLTIGRVNRLAGAGESYFNGLDDSKKLALLGKGKYEAWKAGKFQLSALVKEREDEVYGMMRSVATLKELVG